jgi:tetratricopeptide (TPR) repeat protein
MAQRHTVSGRRSVLAWVAVALVLVLAIALAVVVFVIGPERQLDVQAAATARAHASEVQRTYDAGTAFATAGDWQKAAEEFAKVVALEPGYKDAAARLAETRANANAANATATGQAIAMAEQAAAMATAEIRSAIESAYQRGLAYFNLERWEQAKAEFEQVIALDPNHKDVQAKLTEAEARLAEIRALTPTAPPTTTPGPSPTPLPTATSTSRPTATARPTNTPIPSPTPISTTALDTILKDGETWYAEGWSLTVSNFTYKTLNAVQFVLQNWSDKTILFPVIDGGQFTITTDTGEKFQPCYFYAWNQQPNYVVDQTELEPGERLEWTWEFRNRDRGCETREYSSAARILVLTVKNLADVIINARWQTEIPRP